MSRKKAAQPETTSAPTTDTAAKAKTTKGKKQQPTGTPTTAETKTPRAEATTPGVRPVKSRSYWAGVVIAKHGLGAGVTPAMIAEVDALFGKPNPTQTKFDVACAWHTLNGYVNGAAKMG